MLDLERKQYHAFLDCFIYAKENGYVNFYYNVQIYNAEAAEKILKEKSENK